MASSSSSSSELRWTWARMAQLSVHDLHDALALRSRVFVVEQRCAYQDVDGNDPHSWHLLGRAASGALHAYLRVVDAGVRYAEPSMGRVVTAPEARGTGLGHALLREGLARCRRAWPGRALRISAQAHLQRYYGAWGFAPVGAPYLEDDIAHIEMLCNPPPLGDLEKG